MNHDNKMAKPDSLDFKVHYFQQKRKKRKSKNDPVFTEPVEIVYSDGYSVSYSDGKTIGYNS